jgi:hypothetical protein
MKKLLLVLLVVTLASFLFVGCLPTTPTEGEGEGESEAEICPTVSITSQVAVAGKNYIKAGSQTITVTFAVPTEPVSVYVGGSLKLVAPNNNTEGVPNNAVEVVMYPDAEKKIYTGTFNFSESRKQNVRQNNHIYNPCSEDYIYVLTCDTCAPCKFPYTVDGIGPHAAIKIAIDDCECAGCEIAFESTSFNPDCEEDVECCGDDCSGLANWSIVLYDDYPFDECCDPSVCEEPIGSGSGTECPIYFSTECLTAGTYYAVVTLVDAVGNETVYYAKIVVTGDGLTEDCDIQVTGGEPLGPPSCVYWETFTSDTIGWCAPLFEPF